MTRRRRQSIAAFVRIHSPRVRISIQSSSNVLDSKSVGIRETESLYNTVLTPG